MKYYYRAYCGKCDDTRKTGRDTGFMCDFFLGDRCTNCGEYKSERHGTDWRVEFGRMVRVKKFELTKPRTWFSDWIWEHEND